MTPTTSTGSSTGSSSTGSSSSGSSSSGSSSTGSSSSGSSSTGSSGETGTTTGGEWSTGEWDTDGPIDVTCTFPGSTSAGPDSPDLAPECACIDAEGHLNCSSKLCPTITGDCSGGIGFEPQCHGTWTYNEAALECALQAARDGTEGTITWYFSPNSGYSSHGGFLHIVPGRRAIRQDRAHVDLGGTVSDTELWELRDAQYFQGCLDLDTFCARLHCFFGGTSGGALSLCLPSFDYSDF